MYACMCACWPHERTHNREQMYTHALSRTRTNSLSESTHGRTRTECNICYEWSPNESGLQLNPFHL